MDGGAEFVRDGEIVTFMKTHKGYEIVESHEHQYHEVVIISERVKRKN